ncbi:MAG TPA: hypothetical protein VF659_20550 [Pyrinomonadaceae bacterium]|jgi:hypothetical protein
MPTFLQPNGHAEERPARAALVVSHPGHELRVHGWLETALPLVCVLTDGSGRTQRSRLDSTTRVLEAAGAAAGDVYGAMTDAELYAAVLDFEHERFTRVVDDLAAMMLRERVNCVAGDAAEGYNPAHDICRLLVNAAVRLVRRTTPQSRIANYDFTLIAPPRRCPEALSADAVWLRLDEAALARKLTAARNYPELQAEVEAALSGAGSVGLREHPDLAARAGADFAGPGANDFSVECLRPVDARRDSTTPFDGPRPFYEEYGERQVLAGHYERVLRYGEHVLPLAAALDAHVERNS